MNSAQRNRKEEFIVWYQWIQRWNHSKQMQAPEQLRNAKRIYDVTMNYKNEILMADSTYNDATGQVISDAHDFVDSEYLQV